MDAFAVIVVVGVDWTELMCLKDEYSNGWLQCNMRVAISRVCTECRQADDKTSYFPTINNLFH